MPKMLPKERRKKKLVCIKAPPLHQASCEYNIQGARGEKKQPNKANSLLSCFSFYRPAMPFAVRDDLCAFE
jgi:hypothetical protein